MREDRLTGRRRHRVGVIGINAFGRGQQVCILQVEVERPEVSQFACGPESNLQPSPARREWIDAKPEHLTMMEAGDDEG